MRNDSSSASQSRHIAAVCLGKIPAMDPMTIQRKPPLPSALANTITSSSHGRRNAITCCKIAASIPKEFVTTTPSQRPRLLIIDDSPTALVFLEAIFKGANYQVETAATGEEGIEKALRLVPDLVITDGIMPDVDGFAVIQRMRAHPSTAHVPVIMLTSGDFRDSEYADRLPQPDAYVAKSMDLDPLLKQVKKMLKN